ncbi:MAG: prepilin-type N-terminal cleavage/methylation domain-containing protein [Cyanobacteria bacterium SIG26]|nr:prepilin-type N-terminal cleavage/methylation domain-containing protein [Cyanobacteria bacterium SIG26]
MAKRRYSNLFGGGVASISLVTRLSTILRSVKNNEFCHFEQSRHLERGREDGRSGVCLFNVRLRERSHIKAAFTLPEILITIGIIGIVAAMTVPNLVLKYQKSRDLNRLKKVYAELVQVFRSASQHVNLYSVGNDWENTNEVVNAIKPYLHYSKAYDMVNVYSASKSMCYEPGKFVSSVKGSGSYVWLTKVGISNPIAGNTASILLNNGACVGFNRQGKTDRTIILDINGPSQLPNMVGKDVFFYMINKDNMLLPKGFDLKYSQITSSSSSGHGCACDKVTKKCGAGMYCAARIWRDGWQINYY